MIARADWRRWAVIAAVFGVALLIVGVAVMLVAQSNESRNMQQEVELSHRRRALLQTVLSEHQDMETGQRGYILSGQRSFLEPYDDARRHIGISLNELERLPAAPGARADMALLRRLSKQKLAFATRTIALRRKGNVTEAQSAVSAGEGKIVMDQIRAEIGRQRTAEEQRLTRVTAQSRLAQDRLRLNSLLLLGILTLLLIIAGLIILHTLRARKQAFERLDDISRRRQAILDGAMDAIFILNPSGSIEATNRAATRIYGYTFQDMLRRDIGMLFADPPPNGQVAAYLRSMRLVEGEPGHMQEIIGRRSDGTVFPTDVAVTAISLRDGTHYVAVARDISEHKRAERMKAEFVASVSHELRTPLTSIAGSLGLLIGGAGGMLPDKAQRLIVIARDNAERLVRLINDILDIEKIDSGRMTFANRYVDLAVILREAVQSNQGYADKYGVMLHMQSLPDAAVVWADPDRLMQVFANLISNAVKFSPAGEAVDIVVRTEHSRHRISVCDKGRGIDAAFRSRIFNRFAQADASDSREKSGTGLGLSIVKEIVTRLGGAVSFESEPGEGTQFHVDLPAAQPDETNGAVDRLLICERNVHVAGQMAEALADTGLACDVVNSTAQAMKAAQERRYRVILVDSNLPSGGGIALVRSLRQVDGLEAVPILMISADNRHGGIEAEALRIVDWLQKPLPLDRLVASVGHLLEGERRTELPHVLHVDDDPDVLRLVAAALEGQADLISVDSIGTARAVLAAGSFDLAILDLGLADGSGLDLLPDLRRPGALPVPVIIFSAQDADPAVAATVEAYLTKSRTPIERLTATVQHLWQQAGPRIGT
ncbi:CHASE3 domain-containing protein [Sphingobium sp. TCM1]|uniref:CHASE3 domain-containing protein n=1 Tax=Sphingobium sp. TCM1 TaxID=453246 RepID=UPI0007F53989|nr:CHASE3 domain-containing protein [Sphingobium sp. TCM1]OAN56548.1 hypothetical protein A7Q26_18355 [Sphingobium sp. TCM1]